MADPAFAEGKSSPTLRRWPRVVSWLLLLALGSGVWAVEERPEDPELARVVGVALERNPGWLAVQERRREVAGGVEEVRADALPQLDLIAAWSRSRNPALLNSPDFDDIIEQFPDFRPGEQELWDVGIHLQQPLYSGGKVKAARRLAESVVDVTEAQIRVARLDVAAAAAEAYYGWQAARRALEAVRHQEAARQAALDVVEARFELAEATRLEWLRARSALAELGPRRARAEGGVEVAASRLRFAMGMEMTEPLGLMELPETSADADALPGPTPAPLLPAAALPRLLSVARDERPELEDLRLQLEALGHQRHINVAGGRPQVDLNGRYGRQVSDPDNFDSDLFADWLAAVSLRWSFFDGGRRKGQLAQLDSQRQQLMWTQRQQVQEISSQLAVAATEYETARQRLAASELSLQVAQEARRVALETYQQGVTLQADLIAAQDDEIQAELERIAAFYEGRVKGTRLRRALGRLPTEPLPVEPPATTPGGDPRDTPSTTTPKTLASAEGPSIDGEN